MELLLIQKMFTMYLILSLRFKKWSSKNIFVLISIILISGKMDDVLDSIRAVHLRRNIYRHIPKFLVPFLLWN